MSPFTFGQVFQRQIFNEGPQKVIDGKKATDQTSQLNLLSSEARQALFTLRPETRYGR